MEEFITAFAITLFALSQISERISNFLKLYLPESLFGNLKTKEADPKEEKIREKRLMFISWIAGMITALLCWSIVMGSEANEHLQVLQKIKPTILVYLGLSIFLSFGAKFWHDLLDIIFLYKNTKRVLKEPETFLTDNTGTLSLKLSQTSGEIAQKALLDQKEKWEKRPGVVAVAVGYRSEGVPVIRFYVDTEKNAQGIGKEIIWVDPNNLAYHIPIEVIVSGTIHAHVTIDQHMQHAVFNASNPSKQGSLGYLFTDNETKERYILSCYHVMRHKHPWNFFRKTDKDDTVKFGSNGSQTATIVAGYRNSDLDIAIAKLSDGLEINTSEQPLIRDTAMVDGSWIGSEVQIKGAKSGIVDAVIYEPTVAKTSIRYEDGSTYDFNNFFSIQKKSTGAQICPTQSGDSGALVYDAKTQTAIGIIVGGNKKLAYAMKIGVIEQKIGIKIKN